MKIRVIEEKDNVQVEQLIRTCLIEFGADKEGTAWSDPYLGDFYRVYQAEHACYWVAEEDGLIVAGCGIGPIKEHPDVCELQKMYALQGARGSGIAKNLLDIALTFAQTHYHSCYLETLDNMHAANRFYLKNGFKRLDQHCLIPGTSHVMLGT
ncbi:histone acetyltransferase HPA2 [Bacillus sp. JCM 19045]|nr:histone acetyltransferase HPA2 [Bacillus sp. JCM 19045]